MPCHELTGVPEVVIHMPPDSFREHMKSLDFAESLLRRGLTGIGLRETV